MCDAEQRTHCVLISLTFIYILFIYLRFCRLLLFWEAVLECGGSAGKSFEFTRSPKCLQKTHPSRFGPFPLYTFQMMYAPTQLTQ